MRYARHGFAAALAAAALAATGCGRGPVKSTVKEPADYRDALFGVTTRLNEYLTTHTPGNTRRAELAAAVNELAAPYQSLAAEAGPLQGKTGNREYGVVAARAEDGYLCAGNLGSALATNASAAALNEAVTNWAAFNDDLVAIDAEGENAFAPREWWLAPAWRAAAGGKK